MNRIGVHYGFWSHDWDKIDYPNLIKKAARLGFDTLEVAAAAWGYYPPERLKELRSMGEGEGASFTYSIGLGPEHDLASENSALREAGMRHVERILRSMPKAGARVLNGVSYAGWQALPKPGFGQEDKRRAEERALTSLKPLLKIAEDLGVDYCFEAVNRFEQYLINTAREAVDFCEKTGSPAAKVLLDTFHMNIEEDDMARAIETAGARLGHFHVGENNRRTPGTGRLPWGEIAAALRQTGYAGAIVMEPFLLSGGSIAADIKVWRDLSGGADEAGMDMLAQSACAFLKKTFT